jgi:DNA-binding transcriptional LysR family regulator
MQSLLEHKCDVAILFSPSTMPGLTSVELAQSELVIVYPKARFPGSPKELALKQLKEFEYIDIGDSGPLADLLSARMEQDNISLEALIKVQTYFIAARLVAQGVGVCVVDRFTAEGNLSGNTAIASFNPPLTFPVKALYLEDKRLSKVSKEFLSYLTTEFANDSK